MGDCGDRGPRLVTFFGDIFKVDEKNGSMVGIVQER